MTAIEAFNFVHEELGLSWRAIAADIGCYSHTYWGRVARGEIQMSRRADNAFRRLLGKPPLGVTQIADMPIAVLKRAYRERVKI